MLVMHIYTRNTQTHTHRDLYPACINCIFAVKTKLLIRVSTVGAELVIIIAAIMNREHLNSS